MNFSKKKLWLIFIIAAYAPLVSAGEAESVNTYLGQQTEENPIESIYNTPTRPLDTQKLLQQSAQQRTRPALNAKVLEQDQVSTLLNKNSASQDTTKERFEQMKQSSEYTKEIKYQNAKSIRNNFDEIIKKLLKDTQYDDRKILLIARAEALRNGTTRRALEKKIQEKNPKNFNNAITKLNLQINEIQQKNPSMSYHEAYVKAANNLLTTQPATTQRNTFSSTQNDAQPAITTNQPKNTADNQQKPAQPATTQRTNTMSSNRNDVQPVTTTNQANNTAEPSTTITRTQRLKNFGSGVLKGMNDILSQLFNRTPKTPEQQEAADLQKSTEDKIKEHEKENGAFDNWRNMVFGTDKEYAKKLKDTQEIFEDAKETAQMDAEKTGKRVVLAKPTVESGDHENPRLWKFHIIDLSKLNADLKKIVNEEYLKPATGKENLEALNTRLEGLAEKIKVTQGTDLSIARITNELIEHINNKMGLQFNGKKLIPLVEIQDPQTTLNRLTTLIANKIPAVQDWVQKKLTKNSTTTTEAPDTTAGNQAVPNSPSLNEVI